MICRILSVETAMLRQIKVVWLFLGLLIGNFNQVLAVPLSPDFHLPTREGSVSLSGLKGEVVYLDFWASWCLPCRKSFPWMNELQARYQEQGLKVIAINLDEDRAVAERFLEHLTANFTVAFDASGQSAETYKLLGMPSSYIIDRQGQLQVTHVGFRERDKKTMEKSIRYWLSQPLQSEGIKE